MRKKNVILAFVAIASLIELVFNWSTLFTYHSKTINWHTPSIAADNDEGTLCVVDHECKRMIILNRDKTVRSIICANPFSSITPIRVADIALNDDFVYISDKVLTKNGTAIQSERVLKYDLDGKYVSTVYTEKENPATIFGNILDISVCHDTLYVLKVAKDTVSVFSIDEKTSEARAVLQCAFDGNPVQLASYQPEVNAVTAYTFNGKAFIYRNGILERVRHSSPEGHITNMALASDSSLYIYDSNTGNIIRKTQDSTEKIIYNSESVWLCHNAPSGVLRNVYVCNYCEESVISISLPDHKVSVIKGGEVSNKNLFNWYRTLISVSILALILLYFLFLSIRKIIIFCLSPSRANNSVEKDGVVTISDLYGKPSMFTLFSFLATSIFLSVSYYNSMVNNAITQATHLSTTISALSDDTFGDALKQIKNADEYGSPEYQFANNFCSSFCKGKQPEGFDLAYKLFRFDAETGEPTYVFDCTGMNVCGTKVIKKRMIHRGTYSFVISVFRGNNETLEYRTENGVDIFYALSPVFDSSENVVGAVLVLIDLYAVKSSAIKVIVNLLLEILTFLAIMLLSFVELKLLRDFLKIRKKRIAAFGKDITSCEGHRTLRILSNMPFFLLIPFISPYTKEMVIESGISGDPGFLSALPLSLSGLSLAVCNLFSSLFTKRNPKLYLQIFNTLRLVSALLLLLNIHWRNYYLLVAIFIFIGISSAVISSCYKAIRFFNLKPDKKYSRLVFTNIETPISISIGTALGALLYDSLGYAAVVAAFISITLMAIVLTKLFIGSDINITKEMEMEHQNETNKGKTNIDLIFRYFRRPDVIGCLLFVAIPSSFFGPFSSYMLPMLNESGGYPVLIVGILTLLTKAFAMMISPSVISKMDGMKFSISFIICMASIAFMLFSFAYQPTMFIFSLMLFVMGIFAPVFNTQIEKFQITSAKSGRIIPNDVQGVFSLAASIGEFAGPVCIAALMNISNVATGLVSGAVCLICVVGLFMTFRKEEHIVVSIK